MKSIIKNSILTLLNLTFIFSQTSEFKLTSNDGESGDDFGIAVDISEAFAVAGARWDDDFGESSGAVYIYKKNGTDWFFQQKITPDDGAAGAYFGSSVAVENHTIVVGAPRDNATDTGSGSAYVFQYDSTMQNWSQIKKLTPQSDTTFYSEFGSSVAIADSHIAVGAIGEHNNAGTVYLYNRDNTQWLLHSHVNAQDRAADASFGFSLAMASGRLLIGAPFGSDGGAVYYYELEDSSWVQQVKLTATSASQNPAFGYAVSLLDTYALIGASGDQNDLFTSGAAYMFHQEGAAWRQLAKLIDGSGFDGEEFGFSVALSENFAIIGARQDDDNGGSSGSVFVFSRTDDEWHEQTKLLPSDGSAGEFFGHSLAMENEEIIVGAPGNNGTGAAYVYSNWIATGIYHPETSIPYQIVLMQNYPNPFNPATMINYQLQMTCEVELSIYNLLGQKLVTLVSERQSAGQYQVKWDARGLTSGIYICRMRSGSETHSRKMILIR
jgi:hypothetical protein